MIQKKSVKFTARKHKKNHYQQDKMVAYLLNRTDIPFSDEEVENNLKIKKINKKIKNRNKIKIENKKKIQNDIELKNLSSITPLDHILESGNEADDELLEDYDDSSDDETDEKYIAAELENLRPLYSQCARPLLILVVMALLTTEPIVIIDGRLKTQISDKFVFEDLPNKAYLYHYLEERAIKFILKFSTFHSIYHRTKISKMKGDKRPVWYNENNYYHYINHNAKPIPVPDVKESLIHYLYAMSPKLSIEEAKEIQVQFKRLCTAGISMSNFKIALKEMVSDNEKLVHDIFECKPITSYDPIKMLAYSAPCNFPQHKKKPSSQLLNTKYTTKNGIPTIGEIQNELNNIADDLAEDSLSESTKVSSKNHKESKKTSTTMDIEDNQESYSLSDSATIPRTTIMKETLADKQYQYYAESDELKYDSECTMIDV